MILKNIHTYNFFQKKFRYLILWGFLFLFPFFSVAQDNYEIRKIKFKGNKAFSKADLLDHLTVHESSFISRKIQKQEPSLYNQDFMETDLERLTRFYQSEGYMDAFIKLDSLSIKEKKKRVNIHISVVEGTPVVIRNVSVNLTDSTASIRPRLMQRLPRRLNLKEGSRFTDQTLYDDISKINGVFLDRGFVYVNTDFKLDYKPEEKKTDITFSTTTGPLCYFGATNITGNSYTKEKIIRRQLNYNVGDRYSRELLDKTRKQLYSLQLYRVVSINSEKNKGNMEEPIPITIRIEEMPRWTSKFGIGYGTEDKFRAFIDATYRGLFGGTSRLNLYAKHSALTPYYVSLSWIEPQFFAKKLSLTVNPYIRRDNEPGYNTQSLGLNIPAGYTFNDKTKASLGYYIERVAQHIEDNDADVPNPEDEQFLYNKSGLSGTFSFNSGQPAFSPEKGGSVSVGAKLNGYIFGGDFNYTRLWIDARKYQKFGNFVFTLRGMIGGIHSSDESGFIPVEDRFYSGGSNSNRGWARAMIGPKRESGTPLGGKSIMEMNFEVRHPVVWIIELAAFMDVSNVWEKAYFYSTNDLAMAVGGGIRINTPIGPVRFDVGVPVWNEKKSVQFFLSVGQAF